MELLGKKGDERIPSDKKDERRVEVIERDAVDKPLYIDDS